MEFLIGMTVKEARNELRKMSDLRHDFRLVVIKEDDEYNVIADVLRQDPVYVNVRSGKIAQVWLYRGT
jgi:hypothetical protein